MIVTVLWEDERATSVKGFGPHDLLLSCLDDELSAAGAPGMRWQLKGVVVPVPKKGNTKLLAALKKDGSGLASSGPVWAVLDRDRILDLWSDQASSPSDCPPGIRTALLARVPGSYGLALLEDNVETLVLAACKARAVAPPSGKPTPAERDELLHPVVWGERACRDEVRVSVRSFDRLVRRVFAQISPVFLPASP